MRSNALNLAGTAPRGHSSAAGDGSVVGVRSEMASSPGVAEAGGDEIAGDAPYCRLALPWAPNDIVAYCASRESLWLVWRDMKPDRTYLRVELDYLRRATDGQGDFAAAATFRAIDRLKARSGGWIIGVGDEINRAVAGAETSQENGSSNMHTVQTNQANQSDQVELDSLKARANQALAYFDRTDVDAADKKAWIGEFQMILDRISELLDRMAGDKGEHHGPPLDSVK